MDWCGQLLSDVIGNGRLCLCPRLLTNLKIHITTPYSFFDSALEIPHNAFITRLQSLKCNDFYNSEPSYTDRFREVICGMRVMRVKLISNALISLPTSSLIGFINKAINKSPKQIKITTYFSME